VFGERCKRMQAQLKKGAVPLTIFRQAKGQVPQKRKHDDAAAGELAPIIAHAVNSSMQPHREECTQPSQAEIHRCASAPFLQPAADETAHRRDSNHTTLRH
jgi:hypothetical protein